MWAFFALENVSTGACSQLAAIICSDIQKRVKRTVNSELHWIKKRRKETYSTTTVDQRLFQTWFLPATKTNAQFVSSVIWVPRSPQTIEKSFFLVTKNCLKYQWVFLSFSLLFLIRSESKCSSSPRKHMNTKSLTLVFGMSFSESHKPRCFQHPDWNTVWITLSSFSIPPWQTQQWSKTLTMHKKLVGSLNNKYLKCQMGTGKNSARVYSARG